MTIADNQAVIISEDYRDADNQHSAKNHKAENQAVIHSRNSDHAEYQEIIKQAEKI